MKTAFMHLTNRELVTLLGALALGVMSSSAHAEGTVNFCNNSSILLSTPSGAPITRADGVKAALYWAPMGSITFLPIGTSTDVGVPVPGLFAGGTRTTGSASSGGSLARFQVRAWSGNFASYEIASQNPGGLIGQSAIVEMATGNPGDPPTPPTSLAANGLRGFALTPTSAGHQPTILVQPHDSLIISGSNATFNVIADGTAPLSYQWRLEGAQVAITAAGQYTRVAAEAGNYTVVVSNPYGAITSQVAVVTVHYLLTVAVDPTGSVKVVPDVPDYAQSTAVTLTANPVPYFRFDHWSFSGGQSSANPLLITMLVNRTITAVYEFVLPDLIVDNPAASFTGTWNTESSSTTKYGADYRSVTAVPTSTTPTATATFTPTITVPGKYDVYAWWPSVSNPNAASTVPFAVVSGSSSNIHLLDQSRDFGGWVPIASGKTFPAGSTAYVRVFNNAGQSTRTVLADAIRLVWSASQPLPPVFRSITRTPGASTLSWVANAGASYWLEYKTNLSDSLWTRLPGTVSATTNTAATNDVTLGTAKQRFYRLEQLP
jgi:hypothetical protein